MDYQEIRDLIANARKRTPVTVHVRHDGDARCGGPDELKVFPTGAGTTILIGEWDAAAAALLAAGAADPSTTTSTTTVAIPRSRCST
jgi:hypothetical protein